MKRFVTMSAVFGAGLMWHSLALADQPQLTPTTMAAYFDETVKPDAPPPGRQSRARRSSGAARERLRLQ